MKRIIVGISGASGVIYGIRLLEVLRGVEDIETHVVVSPAARRTLALETDLPTRHVEAIADNVYRPGDIAAAVSSGSFRAAGMIVAPCSIKTVSGIAMSYSENLLLRAADVTLKERRPLVLLVRETPLHLGHLRLLVQVAELGAVVMPPMPAFYHRPKTLEEIIDQTVNRSLDMLGVELDQDMFTRWQGPPEKLPHRSLAGIDHAPEGAPSLNGANGSHARSPRASISLLDEDA
jgi:4-hydroxy-3-polyprenylbenzoate decarboxylase